MNMKKKQPAKAVLEMLREGKQCHDKLLRLVKEQVGCIQQEDETRLQAIVDEKQTLLKVTRENETKVEQMLAEMSRETSIQIEQEAENLREEMAVVLEKIIALENECQTELLARKFLVQEKILDLKERKTLLKGYKTSQRIKPKISKSV
jgi:DNA-directed RNA polymerase subunit H (RpoH/RPB5)